MPVPQEHFLICLFDLAGAAVEAARCNLTQRGQFHVCDGEQTCPDSKCVPGEVECAIRGHKSNRRGGALGDLRRLRLIRSLTLMANLSFLLSLRTRLRYLAQ